MLKVLVWCSIVIGIGVCDSRAGEGQNGPEVVRGNTPGTAFEIVIDPTEINRDSIAPPPALIAVITTWLSSAFDLPQVSEAPFIRFIPPAVMVALRDQKVSSGRWMGKLVSDAMPSSHEQPEVVAVYDNEARTIYLPDGWSGHTAAELSIVVHEMVHHIQNLAGLKYDCPEAREKLAFAAQEKWLSLFGSDLTTEFGIDSFTVLVRTNCLY